MCETTTDRTPLFQLTCGIPDNFCSSETCRNAASSPCPDHEPVAAWTRAYQPPAIASVTTSAAPKRMATADIARLIVPASRADQKLIAASTITAGIAVRKYALVRSPT